MNTISKKTAFCGLFCGLSTVVLLCTFFPYATYTLAALAGIVLIPIHLEFGTRYGICCYVVTSILALLLTPDVEAKCLYCLLFGYYPLLHIRLSVCGRRVIVWIIKVLNFNASAFLSYYAVTALFKVVPREESNAIIWTLLIVSNITFVLYDIALARIGVLYRLRIHPIFQKFFNHH